MSIEVLIVEPEKRPYMKTIGDDLSSLQQEVGGYIEQFPLSDECMIICNEEGKISGLPLNRAVYDNDTKEMIDIIAGKFFVCYAPYESENYLSLPKELQEKFTKRFWNPERFGKIGNEIVAIPVPPINPNKANEVPER